MRGVRAFVMQYDHRSEEECSTQHFRGGLYGVTASVELHLRSRKAIVQLRGVPIGGSLSGTGWLQDGDAESGGVVLEEAFAKRLAWRLVSIESASLNRVQNTVTVVVNVPIFGQTTIVLKRVSIPDAPTIPLDTDEVECVQNSL